MRHIFTFFFLLIVSQLSAQVTTEVDRKFDDDEFLDHSLSLGSEGIIMYGWEDNTTLSLKQLDVNLQNNNSWKITTEKRTSLEGAVYSENQGIIAVVLKQSKTEYVIHTIEVESKKKKMTILNVPKGTDLSNMILNNDEIWFIAKAKKISFLFKCPIKSPKLIPVNLQFGKEKEVINTIAALDKGEISVSYFYGPNKHREFDMSVLSPEGNILIKNVMESLSAEDKELFINGNITRLSNDDYAITGLYNKKGNSIGNGIYFARYSSNKIKYLSKFDYSDFEHFYDYLGDKQREKIESKIAKKKEKGKEVTISSLSIMHNAILTENGLVFIGEYFYPTYRRESRTSTDANGRMVTTYTDVFDGYQYTHGMAIGISEDGTKLFDYYLPLTVRIKPYYPKRFFRIVSENDKISIVHTSGRSVYSSSLQNGEIKNNEYAVITTIPEDQKERWSASAGIYWYDNYFFILEKQKVKEKGLLGKRRIENYAIKVKVE